MRHTADITALLAAARRGDTGADAALMSTVYARLHTLAAGYMRRERPGHTLQPTALVNEFWLRLLRQQGGMPNDRVHFFATAATVMRHILCDHARGKKRPDPRKKVELGDFMAAPSPKLDELLAVDEALSRLAEWDARQARLVELVYFGGLTLEEAGGELGISERTAKRDWKAARAWLQAQLDGDQA